MIVRYIRCLPYMFVLVNVYCLVCIVCYRSRSMNETKENDVMWRTESLMKANNIMTRLIMFCCFNVVILRSGCCSLLCCYDAINYGLTIVPIASPLGLVCLLSRFVFFCGNCLSIFDCSKKGRNRRLALRFSASIYCDDKCISLNPTISSCLSIISFTNSLLRGAILKLKRITDVCFAFHECPPFRITIDCFSVVMRPLLSAGVCGEA